MLTVGFADTRACCWDCLLVTRGTFLAITCIMVVRSFARKLRTQFLLHTVPKDDVMGGLFVCNVSFSDAAKIGDAPLCRFAIGAHILDQRLRQASPGRLSAQPRFGEFSRLLPELLQSHRCVLHHVAARPRKIHDETASDRIRNVHEYDGNGARLLQQSRRGGRGMRKNKVWLQRDEFLRESLSRLRVTVCRPASVDSDVVALRPPELLESLPECGDEGLSFPVALCIPHQHADPLHPVRLLRARGQRPCRRRTADKRDELSSSHVPPEGPRLLQC